MRILGIDPGTITMGYGVIESNNGEIRLVDCGALTTPARSPIGERLSFLYNKLQEIKLFVQQASGNYLKLPTRHGSCRATFYG